MRWLNRATYEPPRPEEPEQPWMEKVFIVNDKPVNLRTIRRFAVDMAEKDYRNPAEMGLAMTIVALVDEISWLHAQLLDAQQPTKEEA